MTWKTAIKKIEKALEKGKFVGIQYHREGLENDRNACGVDCVEGYDWHGKQYRTILTYWGRIEEGDVVIDKVIAD